jgi:putative cardiolipin synthase
LNAPSGVHLLEHGPSAFLARLAMVRAAERTIDAQYYIWQPDTTGRMLIAGLLRAADWGVRVRLLIDDFGSAANDRDLLLLDQHPNIEVRLFNPVANRSRRTLGMAGDFARLNRRMHNKSLTVDNQLTIVGGRNIGDEYFEAGQGLFYRDLDALAIGAVVGDVSARFDRYWNSPVVWGIADLTRARPSADEGRRVLDELAAFDRQQEGQAFEEAMLASPLARQIRVGSVDFAGANVRVLADDPAKIEQPDGDRSKLLMPQLLPEFERSRDQVTLISPYFVPGREGMAFLRRIRARGVRVRVLTNSMASTDMLSVFATYQKYRHEMLAAGIELYEINPGAVEDSLQGLTEAAGWDGGHERSRAHAALHGKVLVFDCRAIFVGSMNLDPRSAFTNTEIGFVVDAPAVGADACSDIDAMLAKAAYRLALRPIKGSRPLIEFVGVDGGQPTRYESDPHTTGWQRFKTFILSLLPIQSFMARSEAVPPATRVP